MLDLPDLLTQSGFSSSPNGASENLASKEKESTVITKPTPFPSWVFPEGSAAPGWTEPLLYTWLSVTKSSETFPDWMGEEAIYASPTFSTDMSLPFICHKAYVLGFPFTPNSQQIAMV